MRGKIAHGRAREEAGVEKQDGGRAVAFAVEPMRGADQSLAVDFYFDDFSHALTTFCSIQLTVSLNSGLKSGLSGTEPMRRDGLSARHWPMPAMSGACVLSSFTWRKG